MATLRVVGIIWLEDILDKVQRKHHVEEHQVTEVLDNADLFRRVERGHRAGEDVYAAFGQTIGGRYLAAFFVWKSDGRALIVSARDMTATERKRYGKH